MKIGFEANASMPSHPVGFLTSKAFLVKRTFRWFRKCTFPFLRKLFFPCSFLVVLLSIKKVCVLVGVSLGLRLVEVYTNCDLYFFNYHLKNCKGKSFEFSISCLVASNQYCQASC